MLSRSTGASTRCCGNGDIPASTSCHCPSAAWLNLIEDFWKILRQRALAGHICSTTAELDQALQAGVADWNRRPTPFLWNRPPKHTRLLKLQYIYRI
jgi:hypothetical protein